MNRPGPFWDSPAHRLIKPTSSTGSRSPSVSWPPTPTPPLHPGHPLWSLEAMLSAGLPAGLRPLTAAFAAVANDRGVFPFLSALPSGLERCRPLPPSPAPGVPVGHTSLGTSAREHFRKPAWVELGVLESRSDACVGRCPQGARGPWRVHAPGDARGLPRRLPADHLLKG